MDEKLLTIDQLSEMLQVARQTIYGWTCARKINYIKVGGALRFRAKDVEAFIAAGTIQAL